MFGVTWVKRDLVDWMIGDQMIKWNNSHLFWSKLINGWTNMNLYLTGIIICYKIHVLIILLEYTNHYVMWIFISIGAWSFVGY